MERSSDQHSRPAYDSRESPGPPGVGVSVASDGPPVPEEPPRPSDEAPDTPVEPGEFRTTELAEAAGITVRTLRFYRERRLLPPPRREGRIAWYNGHHLARLRTIAALLERGHTLGGIQELLHAFNSGRDTDGTARLLGLTTSYPWSEEEQVRLTPEELAEYFATDVSPENLATALDIGYIAVDGEQVVHVSRSLLDASSHLVRGGLPLATVLNAGRDVREHAEALADLFTTMLRDHLLPGVLDRAETGPPTDEDLHRVTELLQWARPLAKQVVNAEVSLALDRRLREELGRQPETPTPQGTRSEEAADDGASSHGEERDSEEEQYPVTQHRARHAGE